MKILYFIFLIMSAVFYLLFRGDLSFVLLLTLLIFPVMMLVMLLTAKIRIKAENFPQSCVRGDKAALKFKVKNRMFIPVSSCTITFVYRMTGDSRFKTYTAVLPLKARSEENVALNIAPEHCGTVEYSVKKVRVYDLIGLFSKKIKLDLNGSITVLPKELPCCVTPEQLPSRKDENGLLNAGSGNDPSEITGLREYRDGDRMNRIHWKLSSRTDELIVKNLSEPYSGRILVIPDINACRTASEADTVMDVFYSMLKFLTENETETEILCGEDGLPVRHIGARDDFSLYISEMLKDKLPYGKDISLTAEFSEVCAVYAADRFSHIIIITPSEMHPVLSEIEQSGCSERITVLCTGNGIEEDRNSDVIVYTLNKDGIIEIPESFTI